MEAQKTADQTNKQTMNQTINNQDEEIKSNE
jgi:hypothetical protein